MLSATFSAFQDELEKIADALRTMSAEDADKFFGSHEKRIADVEAAAAKFNKERGRVAPSQGTAIARPSAMSSPSGSTKMYGQPLSSSGLTQTHVRPSHTSLPHPGVPGGMGSTLNRGKEMFRTHGAALGIGAGIGSLGMGAIALHQMRKNRNAASR